MSAAAESVVPVIAHLEATMGLSFTGPRRERLLSSIEEQRAAGGPSPEDFLAAVSRPGAAFDRLVAEVTVGETYFFRDRTQCDLLRSVVLPELLQRVDDGQRVSFWSAGCASGEEAFTIAALADEAGFGDRCAVVGSDASRRAIDKANRGVYGKWSMRSTTASELATHFEEQDGRFHVAERLRRHARFLQRNLLDGPPPPGRFDVILCRNLLIYLTPAAVQRVADVLAGALAPRGWLITAAGDPLLEAPGLELVRTHFGLAYRAIPRWAPGEAAAPTRPDATRRRDTRTDRPTSVANTSAARLLSPDPATPPPSRVPARQAPTDPGAAGTLAEHVRVLGDTGQLEEACRVADEAVRAHPLEAELHYMLAVVSLAAGRLENASSAASRAVYLRPDLPAPHVLLGQVEHARGATDRARRSFRNGARLLAAAGDGSVELAGDLPAAHLAAVADRYLTGSRTS